jgi:hypothetical protein
MRFFLHPLHLVRHLISFFVVVCLVTPPLQLNAQEKEDKTEPAAVKLCVPLAVTTGATTKVTVRGLKLDEASEVKSGNDKAQAKLASKGKATVPNMIDAAAVGDTQVEIELTLAKEAEPGDLPLTIVTPTGEVSLSLPIIEQGKLNKVKEPHDGFAKAQAIEPGKVWLGAIEKPKDVDVFRIDLSAGQKLVAEVHAARQGSPLDSILTLFDVRRQIVATNDDHSGARDSRVAFTAPASGSYFLSLNDAHDLGSELHVYRLIVRAE